MTQAHKRQLLKRGDEIVENIRLDGIMNSLLAEDVLKPIDKQKIDAKVGYEQAGLFLEILASKEDWAYDTTINILIKKGQPHIAELMILHE